jgi:uncharacterized damage-inducible protein DinB
MDLVSAFVKEMKAEYLSTRKCLERIPSSNYDYQPHPKSMKMGYLTLLVAEIPLWIKLLTKQHELDFATLERFEPKSSEQLLDRFEVNFRNAVAALSDISNRDLDQTFRLKHNGEVKMEASRMDMISSTLNHWVHHRGQLTVYMRMNDIAVPSIYGPSADEQGF